MKKRKPFAKKKAIRSTKYTPKSVIKDLERKGGVNNFHLHCTRDREMLESRVRRSEALGFKVPYYLSLAFRLYDKYPMLSLCVSFSQKSEAKYLILKHGKHESLTIRFAMHKPVHLKGWDYSVSPPSSHSHCQEKIIKWREAEQIIYKWLIQTGYEQ
jgi:hypothetical protein